MHIKYCLSSALFFTACIPKEPNNLLGESDRPMDPDQDVGVDSGAADTDDVNTPPAELTVDPNSIVITVIGESTEIEPSLVLSVDDNRVLHVEHTVEWDSETISTVLVTQTADYALDFDYGSSGETYIWLILQYSVDISSLQAGTYSVSADGYPGEFVLE